MANRPLHLFAGPSLCAITPTQLNDANIILHAPARRGDVMELVATDPSATIAIADGLFHQQPAVGHVEIRDAIRGGAFVWGLCSIGAIRAAEMSHLGMRGFGEVFESYRNDVELPDDEVALLHHPQPPYAAISEPLIHWRRYLRALEASSLLAASASQRIQADLAGRWYGERTLELGAELLTRIGGIFVEPETIDREIAPHRVKQSDLQRFISTRPWDAIVPTAYSPTAQPTSPPAGLTALGGLPFVDLQFDATRCLSAVAGTRAGLIDSTVSGPEAYAALLEPQLAVNTFTTRVRKPDFIPTHGELAPADRLWAELALRRVKTNSRTLAPLFDLPIQMLRWKSGKVSMTNPFIPQTVFLGDGALQSSFSVLEEVWVHEFAHVWLGMICEVSDLQKRGSAHSYFLPSGTGPKDARGVLFAAHFAGAVLTYLLDSAKNVPLIGSRLERLHYVKWYLRHALEIPIAADLTSMGQSVFERLRDHCELYARGG